MNIVVIRVGEISRFPPAISLVNALLDLGHNVTLLANDVKNLPLRMVNRDGLHLVDFGERGSRLRNFVHIVTDHELIKNYLHEYKDEIDLVWATTDLSARAAGNELLDFPYVLQLSELVEYVPLLKGSDSRLHYRNIENLARQASRVVVPEYNRAHIQQAYWNLPRLPKVLPNKPYPDSSINNIVVPNNLLETIVNEKRKILLYQGVYTGDRSLEAYAKAVNLLGNEYALYIMGAALESGVDWFRDLSKITDRVVDLGFIAAPNHLAISRYGHIGLLPYKATKYSHYSVLNPLYCAPNKIWEYSRFGLPMIGSDVPGLSGAFHGGQMGFTVDGSPESIAEAAVRIDKDYDGFSIRSKKYYDSIDIKQIVAEILNEAMG